VVVKDKLPPANLNSDIGNLSQAWKTWQRQSTFFWLQQNPMVNPIKLIQFICLTVLAVKGDDFTILIDFANEADSTKIAILLQQFEQICNPLKNITMLQRLSEVQRFHDIVTHLCKLS